MDTESRKKAAVQARTQLTITLAIRFWMTLGSIAVAVLAAASAFLGFEDVDRCASIVVVLFLVCEAVIYGFEPLKLIRERDFYSRVIREIDDKQYEPKAELLEMPQSYPWFEAIALQATSLRWKKRGFAADILVTAVAIITLLFFTAVIVGVAIAGNYAYLALKYTYTHR